MKYALSILLILCMLTCGCAAIGEDAAPEGETAAAEAPATHAVVPDDILNAMNVYAYFVMSPLPVDESVPSPDGEMFLVSDENLSYAANMQKLLDSYFSTEISQSLWAWNAYQNVDGRLYGYRSEESPFYRPVEPTIEQITYTIVQDTEKERRYTATILDTSGKTTTYDYVSSLVDGRWIFVEFPFIW
ncbi:MAG: hypothetical protein IJJ23_11620 [Clostridia bacterium]|nr:hypothetical protein [Clostridia bacterium]